MPLIYSLKEWMGQLTSGKKRVMLALVLFFLTFSLAAFSVLTNQQLGQMGKMAEEYYDLSINLVNTGRFVQDENTPFVFRAPGYPIFLMGVLKTWDGFKNISSPKKPRTIYDAYDAIYISQCLLLGLSTGFLFLWLSQFLSIRNSFFTSLFFGANPYILILTGLLHYSILHIFLAVGSGYALSASVFNSAPKSRWILGAGILWGLTTLTRPLTLILPVFILLFFLIRFRPSFQSAIRHFIAFVFGMLLIISPYTLRNYSLTEKFIPVNAQTGIALWAGSSEKIKRNSNYYRWWEIWYFEGSRTFLKITRDPGENLTSYVKHNLALEEEFRKKAIQNILDRPGTYLHNVWQNFLTFILDINSVFIKIFQATQKPGMEFQKEWIKWGNPQNFHSSFGENLFKLFFYLVSITGAYGIFSAVRGKNLPLLLPALIFICFLTAHSLTHMDIMYYYLKWPFYFFFSAYGVMALEKYRFKVLFRGYTVSGGTALQGLMVFLTLALIVEVIL